MLSLLFNIQFLRHPVFIATGLKLFSICLKIVCLITLERGEMPIAYCSG